MSMNLYETEKIFGEQFIIGESDIASLVFRFAEEENGKTLSELKFDKDNVYHAKIVNVEKKINPRKYEQVYDGKFWLIISDEHDITANIYAEQIKVFRIKDKPFTLLIQLVNPGKRIYFYSENDAAICL